MGACLFMSLFDCWLGELFICFVYLCVCLCVLVCVCVCLYLFVGLCVSSFACLRVRVLV